MGKRRDWDVNDTLSLLGAIICLILMMVMPTAQAEAQPGHLVHDEHCTHDLKLLDNGRWDTYHAWHTYSGPNDGRHPYYGVQRKGRLHYRPQGWYTHPDPPIIQRYVVSSEGQQKAVEAPYGSRVRFSPKTYAEHRIYWELLREGVYQPLVSGEYTLTPDCIWDGVLVDWDWEYEY